MQKQSFTLDDKKAQREVIIFQWTRQYGRTWTDDELAAAFAGAGERTRAALNERTESCTDAAQAAERQE